MAASGAKVMALRSIEVARSYGVTLHVRSTFDDGEGTWIGEEDEPMLEKAIISGVTHDTSSEVVFRVPTIDAARGSSARSPTRREHRHDRPERRRRDRLLARRSRIARPLRGRARRARRRAGARATTSARSR